MVRGLQKWRIWTVLFAIIFIAGCAAPPRVNIENGSSPSIFRGRLSVRLEADLPRTQAQFFSAAFELIGTPQHGELSLYTPLGSTAATLSWTAQTATMRTGADVRRFDSLDALIQQALGTDLPVAALFAWLRGEPMNTAGWQADLGQFDDGRLTAHRTAPPPVAELRVILDK